MRTLRFVMVAGFVTLLAAGSAGAVEYYVRTDGNDACNGQTNAGGSSGNCAFKTIYKCESVARCGDTCNVGPGEFFENTKVTIADVCTATTKKRIIGAGANATTVFFQLVGPLSCTKRTGSTYVYECNIPSGAATVSATADAGNCFLQTLGDATIDFEPEASRKQTQRHSVCLTPATSETSIDANDDGSPDTALDTPAGEGFWVHVSGSTKYLVHPYGHLAPSASVRFFPPLATATGGDFVAFDRSKYTSVENMKILHGRIWAGDGNEGLEVRDVASYHAGIWWGLSTKGTSQSVNLVLENARFLQMIRRIRDKGCGLLGNPCSSTADFDTPQACVIRGNGTWVNGLECYSGNEGLSFGGERHTIRNVYSHGFYNHGCKFNERYEDSTLENLVCYNSQEGMHWVNCQKNILMRHITVDGTILIQGQYDAAVSCADGTATGQWNIDIYNSNITKISWNDPYGMDPRQGARGFDTDYNVYFNDDEIVTHNRPSPASDSVFRQITEWRNYSGDTCTSCTRDPNSIKATRAALFLNPSEGDLDSNLADYDLRSGSPAINFGASAYTTSDGKDVDGVTRVDRPDSGAFEYGESGGAVCGNGVIEGSEQCDGTSLGGATCESLGYGAGTLVCSSQCRYDLTGCPPPPAPAAPDSVRRTDQKAR
jgi:hypothetical protein